MTITCSANDLKGALRSYLITQVILDTTNPCSRYHLSSSVGNNIFFPNILPTNVLLL